MFWLTSSTLHLSPGQILKNESPPLPRDSVLCGGSSLLPVREDRLFIDPEVEGVILRRSRDQEPKFVKDACGQIGKALVKPA